MGKHTRNEQDNSPKGSYGSWRYFALQWKRLLQSRDVKDYRTPRHTVKKRGQKKED